jgi:hypothetical protein
MTPETHPVDKELVMAYLDGELAAEQAARIAIHLDQCAECRELAEGLRGISSHLLAWNVEPASQRLSHAVSEELNNTGMGGSRSVAHRKVPRAFLWKNVLRERWFWATAGVVTVVLCVAAVMPLSFQKRASLLPPSRQLAMNKSMATGRESYMVSDQLEYGPAASPLPAPGPPPPPVELENQPPSNGPMIARTASLNISARDFNAARLSLDHIVRAHQGYVASLSISTAKGAPQTLTGKLLIPSAQLDAALTDLKALGRVEQEQQGGEEVTSQVVDLDARLNNAHETETQLTEILRTRTGKIADVLEVEREMARVRGEIESMQAEQKHLRERIDFASIDLSLSEGYQAQIGGGPSLAGRQIRNALVDGFHAAADGVLSVCVFLLNIGPSVFLWGLILFWPARWAWRRWHKTTTQQEPRL